MRFTVLEVGENRLTAEWRGPINLKMTIEGASLGQYRPGDGLTISREAPVEVVAQSSGPAAPDLEPEPPLAGKAKRK